MFTYQCLPWDGVKDSVWQRAVAIRHETVVVIYAKVPDFVERKKFGVLSLEWK